MTYKGYSSKPSSFTELDSWKNRKDINSNLEEFDAKLNKYLYNGEGNIFNKTDNFKNRLIKESSDLSKKMGCVNFNKNLNLTPTPANFFSPDELIIFFRDKLYSLSVYPEKSSDKQKIKFLDEPYYLIELESFLSLEKDYLNRNKSEIDSFKANYIKELTKENSIIDGKYNFIGNLLKEDDSLDSLIKNYFFPITKNINIEKILSENKRKEIFEKNIDINKIRNIDFKQRTSFFQSFLNHEDSPILITSGNYYIISKGLKLFEEKGIVETKYKKFIKKKIEEKIRTTLDSYFEEVLRKDKNLNERISEVTSCPHRDYGAEKINENEYVLFKNAEEYGVEWKGRFYIFPPLKIGIGLAKTSSGYKLDEKAFAYKNPYYKHPYIQGEKGKERRDICTAGRLNTIHSQIGFKPESNKDGANLMKSAKLLLNRFENIIKRGHNSSHKPFDSIPESARLISSAEANQYINRGMIFFQKTYGN